ncbi:MAG: anthranilate synthase component I family protein, partial [Kiritimatiellia bacterium]
MLKILSEEEFIRRTRDGARTPVYREYLADRETPVAILTRAAGDESVFLLESVSGGENVGRYSYLGVDPTAVVEAKIGEHPLAGVRAALGARPFAPAPELPSLQGGAIGYLAYDAVKAFVPRVGLTPEAGTPSSAFLLTDTILVFDHVRQTVFVVRVTEVRPGETASEAYRRALREIDAVGERLLSAASIARVGGADAAPEKPFVAAFKSEMTEAEFEQIVTECKAAIRAGEVIQIVPSQKFTAETNIPPLALYRALRMVNPSPYNFFLKLGKRVLIGSSPEELVKLRGRQASTAPIAGTRPRGGTPEVDRLLEAELKADEKERAEHVMLVDLGRNDLGRVCRTGSVRVEDFAHVERYSHV